MKKIIEYIKKNDRKIIIYSTLIFSILTIIMTYTPQRNNQIQEKIKEKIKEKIEYTNPGEEVSGFIQKANYFLIENKTNIKLPFISYNDKLLISTKLYNKNKNLQINIEGDIKVKDKQLKNEHLKTIKATKHIISIIQDMKNLIKVKKCERVTAKNIFVYIDKGISLTFRKKTEFVQLNILNNKIFVWQERENIKNENKYLLCNFNANNIYDKLSEYVQEIKILQKNE